MKIDALTGSALVAAAEAAQAALDAGNPPAGSSEARFVAAMIARVRELAKRDQAFAPAIAAREAALVAQFGKGQDLSTVAAAIRAGMFDGDAALHLALGRLAILRVRATNPDALAPGDRAWADTEYPTPLS